MGDESDTDNFININDGWIKIAKEDSDTHKFDTEGSADYLNTVFPGLLAAMPNKYYSLYTEEDKSKIKIFCSPTVNRKYKQQLQARNTALGDALITGGKNVSYDGFEIVPVAFIPDDIQIVTLMKILSMVFTVRALKFIMMLFPVKQDMSILFLLILIWK